MVAVSATLGVGGNPRPSLDKIGWQLVPDERRLPEMVIPSPFDYPANAVLAFARAARQQGVRVIVDPAPAQPMPPSTAEKFTMPVAK